MATGSTVLHKDENGDGGKKMTPCPLYGCKRVYTDMGALESHIKDHEIPAQSLPGKVMLCPTVGCGGSFSNMQKLMEHMRHHHKPNIFFLCESCRTKLRSYRGLLTHLHTCSKVSRGKPKSTEPTHPQPASAPNPNLTPIAMDQALPRLDFQSSSQISNPDGSNSSAVHSNTSASQLAPQELTTPQLPLRNGASNVPPPLNLNVPAAINEPFDTHNQNATQSASSEPVHPAPVSAPHSPSGSSAVWKRNQGMSHSRRILWEHTKGRYTCVQCGQTATNRKEMTQHINSQHSGNKAAEDTGSTATNM